MDRDQVPTRALFWASLALLTWVHVGYGATIAVLARVRPRPVRKGERFPIVTILVPAHDEEAVIERRIENLLELDYPNELVEVLVVSDGSDDQTDDIVERIATHEPRVRLLRVSRRGKLAALDSGVRHANGEVLAFTDANTNWAQDALAKLVRSFEDGAVGYVCGQLRLAPAAGSNRGNLYWRYELWLRAQESTLGSVTGGNGAIYAVRRSKYVRTRLGHDLGLPLETVRLGQRAVYEPEALAFEKQPPDLANEYSHKVRTLQWSWQHVLEAGLLRDVGLLHGFQLVSHRLLRYNIGAAHLAMLGASVSLSRRRRFYRVMLGVQLGFLALAGTGLLRRPPPGGRIAAYYLVVTSATLDALVRYLRSGVPLVWDKAPGTR